MAEPVNNLLSGYVAPDVKRRMSNALLANQFNRPTPQDGPVTERAGLLPLGTYANGQTGLAWPGLIAQPAESFYKAATGQVQPGTPEFAEAGFDVGGAAMVGGLLAPRPRGSLGMGGRPEQPKGITAYHGSPHDFDRFDMSKIGTGEGAQAYGHGLYFAEREGVARSYRDALSGQRFKDGTAFDDANPAHQASTYVAATKSKDEAIAALNADIEMSRRQMDDKHAQILLRARGMVERGEPIPTLNSGRMYEVRINAEPEDFLDWDKPLSQQSEKAKAVFYRLLNPNDALPKNTNAEGVYGHIKPAMAIDHVAGEAGKLGSARAVTDKLAEAGIPGIRYLDQGSRTAGEGSRNYVVFDDNLVEILRKYGLAGFGAGAAAYGMEPSQQAPPVNNLLASYYGGT